VIKGINHINLSVKDLDESFMFYKEILGFVPLARWRNGAYFLVGDLWFCLSLCPKGGIAKGYTHYSFTVDTDNFDIYANKLRELGVKTWKENTSEGNSLYILDPDGHQLEIHVGDWQSRISHNKANPWPDAEFFV
jgi:catechol 2,3-dioxygenase-like lactoylglutathione lyase family enzyme